MHSDKVYLKSHLHVNLSKSSDQEFTRKHTLICLDIHQIILKYAKPFIKRTILKY